MSGKKRKICFVITSPIHYSRNLLILRELKKQPNVELHVALGGSVLLSRYVSEFNNIALILERGGFKVHRVYFYLDGDLTISKAKTTGLAILEFSTLFDNLKPDLVVVRADRFEVLSAAVAAVYMNIPVAHIEGGDVSGTLDESIRHAISKLSHLHFVTNQPARQRLLKMGENPKYVFNFGSPDIEIAHILGNADIDPKIFQKTGSGSPVDFENFIMVMFHPVVSELKQAGEQAKILLDAVYELDIPALWFWPNTDAGSEKISHVLRSFDDKVSGHKIRFTKYLPVEVFLWLLKHTKCLVGNSSAGIKECSYFGIPVVDVGSRQLARLKNKNVKGVGFDKEQIKKTILEQIAVGRYKPSKLYYSPDTGKKIAKVLAKTPLYIQKKFID